MSPRGLAARFAFAFASTACASAGPEPRAPERVPALAAACASRALCASVPLERPRARFRHARSAFAIAAGEPRHRARDVITRPGMPTWVMAKFAYGVADVDLEDEDVAIDLSRGCRGAWEPLGVARTSATDAMPDDASLAAALRDVPRSEGRVYVDLAGRLGARGLTVGRHRLRFTVLGDGSTADAIVDVLGPEDQIALSDVDGTLTENEFATYRDVIGTTPPAANPGAAEALTALALRGYRVVYLTARPDWLVPRTRTWLEAEGFPVGSLRTVTGAMGAFGPGAAAFKAAELAKLRAELGVVPAFAFGNMPSDVVAYRAAGVDARRAYFFRFGGAPEFGIAHADYARLADVFGALEPACGSGARF